MGEVWRDGRPDLQPFFDTGVLKTVVADDDGTSLVGAYPAGAEVVEVVIGALRTEGQLRIAGNVYAYTRDDVTVSLTPGLAAPTEDGEPVESLTPAGEVEGARVAVVDIDGDGDPEHDIHPTISGDLHGFYPLGDARAGAIVKVRDTTYGYEVVGPPLESSTMDPDSLDRARLDEIIGESTGPTDPPAASPAIEAHGTVDAIILESATPADSWTEVEYHASTTPGFTPGPSTLLAGSPARQLVFTVTNLPDGTRLEADTTYYFRAVAVNDLGAAAPSAQVSAQLDPEKASELFLALLAAGNVRAGRIDVGPGYWDPDEGMVIPQDDGQITRISTLSGVPSQWAGKVIATFLTVMAGILTGLLEVLGTIRLSRGVLAPRTGPEAAASWGVTELDLQGNDVRGLTDHPTHASGPMWVAVDHATDELIFYSKATGDPVESYLVVSGPLDVTRIGTEFYVLYVASGTYRIARYAADGSLQATWSTGITTTVPPNGHPVIGPAPSNRIVMAYPEGGNSVRLRRMGTDTGALIDSMAVGNGSNEALGGVAWGTFDYGAERIVVARESGADPRVFDAAGTRQTAAEFPRANGNRVRGLWWDGTRFHSLNTAGTLFHYATNPAGETRHFAHAWLSEDGTRETQTGPTVALTRPARAYVTVTTPPPPEAGTAGVSKANRVSIYSGSLTSNLRRQATLATGVVSYTAETFPTTGKAPETVNGFASVASNGRIESEATNGTGRPHTELLGDGSVRLAKFEQRGVVASGPLVAGVDLDVAVTFPVPFDTAPVVCANPVDSNVPQVVNAIPVNATVTGFTMRFHRTSGTAGFNAAWSAGPPTT